MAIDRRTAHITDHENLILDAAVKILDDIGERCTAAEYDAPTGYVPGVSQRDLIVAGTIASRASNSLSTVLIGLRVYLEEPAPTPDPVEPQSLRAAS